MQHRRNTLVWLAASPLLMATTSSFPQQRRNIKLEQIDLMFARMRAGAPWNVDGPLLWGYFFLDSDPQRLKQASEELSSKGYRIVGISEHSGRLKWRLHVEKVETHTPQSLHARNGELYDLADKLNLASYDGMDVGPPPK